MKKTLCVLFAAVLLLAVSIPAMAATNMKLAHNLAEDHAVHIQLTAFADAVREKTGGEINIEVVPNGTLGSEGAVLEQVGYGMVEMTKVSAATLGNFASEWNALSVPYVFNDQEHYYNVMDGEIAKDLYLTTEDQGFIGLFFMTAFVVLMISFMASSITTMRQVQPIREMVQATRRYAEGDFDIRMNDYGRDDEIGELAASFNNMAESLQQTERQRREFIANISHELKTPMTTIAGYTDGILDGTIPPENERQYLQIISDESRRLSRMVRRMLDVSQLQAIDPLKSGSHFDICESMRRVLISMEKKITDRDLDVDADIPEEPILVLGDNDMITQVIYNLLENATKFARSGSTLYLGVTTIDGKARVTVRNLGDTIPAEELPLLFERFHKSDKSRSEDKDGVGLGLYIVKTILEQHKEKINVTSENGVTTFTFSLAME